MQSALAEEQDHLGGAANAGAKDEATVKLRKAVRMFMKSSENPCQHKLKDCWLVRLKRIG